MSRYVWLPSLLRLPLPRKPFQRLPILRRRHRRRILRRQRARLLLQPERIPEHQIWPPTRLFQRHQRRHPMGKDGVVLNVGE